MFIVPALRLDSSRCFCRKKSLRSSSARAPSVICSSTQRDKRESSYLKEEQSCSESWAHTPRWGETLKSSHPRNQPEESRAWKDPSVSRRVESLNRYGISPAKSRWSQQVTSRKTIYRWRWGWDELLASWQISTRHIITCSDGVWGPNSDRSQQSDSLGKLKRIPVFHTQLCVLGFLYDSART